MHVPRAAIAAAACTFVVAACAKHEQEPPSREERVAQADSIFTPELFDTIAWTSDADRAFVGNNAYAAQCRDCHGWIGQGETGYAREHGIDVPSLVRVDWPWQDMGAMRRRIFTGHPAGMPTWGVAGISLREIDAVAYYVLFVLRPEVQGQRQGQR